MHAGLGLSTELALARTQGDVIDRGDYIVVRSPDNPDYHLGNALVLPAPPQVGEVAFWTRRYADEFRDLPAVRHVALRWGGSTKNPTPLMELVMAGFKVETHAVLAANEVATASTSVSLRALRADEMDAVSDLTYALADEHNETYRRFLDRRAVWKARMIERGIAMWWGAFDSSALVGSLGLVKLDVIARYQDVQTAASHRKRGIASALVAAAAAQTRADHYVIVSEGDASHVYTRLGFEALDETIVSARSSQ